jgi:ribonuclease P protein component
VVIGDRLRPVTRTFSLSKSKRLTKTAEFDRVRKEGTRFRGAVISLSVLPGASDDKFRAGFITSRKVGSAVARNRVRRRLREIVRRHQHELNVGVWMVLIASPHAVHASYAELEAEYLRLAGRASILAA